MLIQMNKKKINSQKRKWKVFIYIYCVWLKIEEKKTKISSLILVTSLLTFMFYLYRVFV